MDRTARDRILRRVLALSREPRPGDAIKLAGRPNFWRVRVGAYRIVYTISDRDRRVLIVKAGHRREVYRRR